MVDLRTNVEKRREERNQRICNCYVKYISEMPSVAPHRIFGAIANSEGMTRQGVKEVLIRYGLYEAKKRSNNNQ